MKHHFRCDRWIAWAHVLTVSALPIGYRDNRQSETDQEFMIIDTVFLNAQLAFSCSVSHVLFYATILSAATFRMALHHTQLLMRMQSLQGAAIVFVVKSC